MATTTPTNLSVITSTLAALGVSTPGTQPSTTQYVTYRGARPGPVRLRGAALQVAVQTTAVTLTIGGMQVQVEKTSLQAALFQSLAQTGSVPLGPLTFSRRGRNRPLYLEVQSGRRPTGLWLPVEAISHLANLLR